MRGRIKRCDLAGFMRYEIQELGHSEETGVTYERLLRSGASKLGKEVWQVSVADARALMARQDISWRWKSGYISALKAYRRWGVLEGAWEMNGFEALRAPKRRFPEEKAPISDETARRLLEAARGSSETRIIYLPLFAGLRLQESTLVEGWGDRIKVFGKGAKIRHVPVHPELDRLKSLILERQPGHKATLRQAMKRLVERVNARDLDGEMVTPHSLRHSFATMLSRNRVPEDIRKEIMGHSRGTDGIYARIPSEYLVEPVSEVDYYSGEPVQLSLL